ncbi:MAG: hypothetical protein EZS28_010679 [Streblomastix strix]|uniref:Uncharacterized protein n=1 Tax=Streblomastix strix TaxID=222440 RepID=A0A5J4WGV8_9EUKA|nr:MAG: hypothetical protein EZS28_010679 [Streblomastix strix]
MNIDKEDDNEQFDTQNFLNTLAQSLDTPDQWVLEETMEELSPRSKTEALRAMKKCYEEKGVEKVKGVQLAIAVNCNPSLVTRIMSPKPTKKIEKKESATLSVEQEQRLVQYCNQTIDESGYITPIEIRMEASTIARHEEGHSWHDLFLQRHKNEFCTISVNSMEESRFKIKEEDIYEYEQTLTDVLIGITPELIFQGDEVGYQQFADARSKVIIVKQGNQNRPLHYPVDRSETRLSIMACDALSTDVLLPYLLIKRPLDLDKFKAAGIRDNVDAVLAESEGTTMTADLYVNWLLQPCRRTRHIIFKCVIQACSELTNFTYEPSGGITRMILLNESRFLQFRPYDRLWCRQTFPIPLGKPPQRNKQGQMGQITRNYQGQCKELEKVVVFPEVIKNEVQSVIRQYFLVELPLVVASESSYSLVASNIASKLFVYNYMAKNYLLCAFIGKSVKFLQKVATNMFQQQEFSKQVAYLGSF